jgi:hypothetical protein
MIVFAPAPPILELLCGFGDRLFADLDIHETFPSGYPYLAA